MYNNENTKFQECFGASTAAQHTDMHLELEFNFLIAHAKTDFFTDVVFLRWFVQYVTVND